MGRTRLRRFSAAPANSRRGGDTAPSYDSSVRRRTPRVHRNRRGTRSVGVECFFFPVHTEVSTTPRLDRSPSTGYERLCAKEFEPDSFCVESEAADDPIIQG